MLVGTQAFSAAATYWPGRRVLRQVHSEWYYYYPQQGELSFALVELCFVGRRGSSATKTLVGSRCVWGVKANGVKLNAKMNCGE